MSTTIDNRIVQMEFDNKEFEKGVKTTMDSLEKFKKSLEFDNVRSGTDEIERGFHALSGAVNVLQSSVMHLDRGFTTLWGNFKRKVLENLAGQIESQAKRIGRALTFEGIDAGKGKYETKMNAVRTIMAATKRTAEEVEPTLQKLNDYTDMTSYKFDEMITYISNFTSVGVELEDAEMAMEGIANASARAGVGTNEAGRAMREFSQAMSAGSMKYENWKTLEGMKFATKEFKEQVLEAAVANNVLSKSVDKTGKAVYTIISGEGKGKTVDINNFGEMLRYDFMTRDVMEDVLKLYADTSGGVGKEAYEAAKEAKTLKDAIEAVKESIGSGWAKSWEIVFGNVDEAAEFFTDLCDTIIEATAAIDEWRNAILTGWREGGGRDSMIATLKSAWDILMMLSDAVIKAWRDVNGALTSTGLLSATQRIQAFVERVRSWLGGLSSTGVARLIYIKRAIQGILSVFKIAKNVIGGVVRFFARIFKSLIPKGTLEFFGDLGKTISDFADDLENNDVIGKFFEGLADGIVPAIHAIGEFIGSVIEWVKNSEFFKAVWGALVDFFTNFPAKVNGFITWVKNTWNAFLESDTGKTIKSWIEGFLAGVPEAWEKVKNWFSTAWAEGGNTIGGFLKVAGTRIWEALKAFVASLPARWKEFKPKLIAFFTNVWSNISEWWQKTSPAIGQWVRNLIANLPEVWQKVSGWLSKTFAGIIDFFRNLFGGTSDAIAEAAESAPKEGPVTKVTNAITGKGGLAGFLKTIGDFFANWASGFGTRFVIYAAIALGVIIFLVVSIGKTLRKISAAVDSAARAWKGAQPEPQKTPLYKTLLGVAGLIASISALTYVISLIDFAKSWPVFALIGALVLSVVVLAAIVKKAKLDEAVKAIAWIGIGFLAMAASLLLVIPTILLLAGMDWGVMLKGIVGITLILAPMTAAMILISKFAGTKTGKDEKIKSNADAFIALAVAMRIIVPAIVELADVLTKIDVFQVIMIGTFVSVLMLVMAKAIAMTGDSFKTDSQGKMKSPMMSILAFAILVRVVANAVMDFAKIPFWQLVQGTIAAAGLMLAIGYAISLTGGAVKTQEGQKTKTSAGVILAFMLLCNVVFDAVKAFAKMKLDEVAIGVGAVAIIMGSLALVFSQVAKIQPDKTALAAIITVSVLIIAVIVGMIAAIKMLKDEPIEKMITIFVGFAVIFGILALAFSAVGKMKPNGEAVGALAVITAMIYVLGQMLVEVKDIDWKVMLSFAAGISAILLVGSLFASVAGKLPAKAAAVMLALLAALAAGVLLIGIAVSAVVSLGAGALQDLAGAITTIAYSLSLFMENTSGVTEGHMNMIFGVLEKFADVFFKLMGVDYSAVYTFSSNTYRLGVAIKRYGELTSSLNFVKIDKSLEFVGNVKTAADTMGKVKNVGNMSRTIANLGSAIKLYYKSLSGLDISDAGDIGAVDIQGIARMLTDLATALPESGILDSFDEVTSTGDLTQFALDITSLGTALQSLASDVGSASKQDITDAIAMLNQIKLLAVAIPSDTELDTAFGTLHQHYTSLGDFALDIEALAAALNSLSQCFGENPGEGKANVTDAIAATQAIADIRSQIVKDSIGENLTAIGDWISGIASNDVWNNFVNSIGTLGANVKTMVDKLAESNFDQVKEKDLIKLRVLMYTVTGMYGSIAAAANQGGNSLSGLDTILAAIGNNSQWNNLVKSIPGLATGISTMVNSVNGVDLSALDDEGALDNLERLLTSVSGLYASVGAAGGMADFGKGFADISGGIIAMATAVESEEMDKVTDDNLTKAVTIINALGTLYSKVTIPSVEGASGIASLMKASAANSAWRSFNMSIPFVSEGVIMLAESVSGIDETDLSDDEITKMQNLLNALAGVYSAVATAVPTNAGSVISSIFGANPGKDAWIGFAAGIPYIADGIVKMSAALKEAGYSEISDDEIRKMENILTVLSGLYSSVTEPIAGTSGFDSVMTAIAQNTVWTTFTGSFGTVATGLVTMAEAVTGDEFREIKAADITTMTTIIGYLGTMYNQTVGIAIKDAKGFDALMSAIGANTVWTGFVESFKTAAIGLCKMAEVLTDENFRDITDDDISKMKTIITHLADMYGVVIKAGLTDVAEGKGISALDKIFKVWTPVGIATASNAIWDEYVGSFETIATGFSKISDAVDKYPIEDEGLLRFMTLIKSLTDAYHAVASVDVIGTYSTGTYGYDKWKNFTSNFGTLAYDIADMYSQLMAAFARTFEGEIDIPEERVQSFTALANLITAAVDLVKFAAEYRGYADHAFDMLRDLFGSGEEDGGLQRLFAGLASIDNADPAKANSVKETVTSFTDVVNEMKKLVKAGSGLTPNDTTGETLSKIGETIVDWVAVGMYDSFDTTLYDAMSELILSLRTSANSRGYSELVSVGANIDKGLAIGINSYKLLPRNAMLSVIQAVIDIARLVPEIESPSKVMGEIGMYLMMGLANGEKDYGGGPVNEMERVMNQMVEIAEWIAPSLADGVLSEKEQFVEAMELLGNAGEEALRDQLEIHSISPLFWGVGEWIPISIGHGVDSKKDVLSDACIDAGKEIEKAFEKGGTLSLKWLDEIEKLSPEERKWLLAQYGDIIDSVLPYGKRHILDAALGDLADVELPETLDLGYLFDDTGFITAFGDKFGDKLLGSGLGGLFGVLGEGFVGKAFDSPYAQLVGAKENAQNFLQSLGLGNIPGVDFSSAKSAEEVQTMLADALEGLGLGQIADKIRGASITNLIDNLGQIAGSIGSGGLSGYSENPIDLLLGYLFGTGTDAPNPGDADTQLMGLLEALGLKDLDWGEADEGGTTVTGSGGQGGGQGGGGQGGGQGGGGSGGYGGSGLTVTPGGLLLSSTDGYTIGDIVSRIDRLEEAITGMQVVLDSGVLVGALGRDLDRQLGDYILFEGRRN